MTPALYITRNKRLLLVFFTALTLVTTGAFFAARPVAWILVRRTIRWKFPEVRQLSTRALAAWLQDTSRPQPLLLDARTPAEFNVSHLPGARRVDFLGDVPAQLAGVSTGRPVVVYCSVGYRSSIFATALQKAGFSDVQNLEGSIFQWVNEGHQLADGARRVHPYNRTWGLLIKPGVRTELAEAHASAER